MPKKMSAVKKKKRTCSSLPFSPVLAKRAFKSKVQIINGRPVRLYKNIGRYNEVTKSAVGTIPGSPVGD